jgi:hypothetical protein
MAVLGLSSDRFKHLNAAETLESIRFYKNEKLLPDLMD